jgi:uncharacterized membrane protein YedE/YeeE
MDMMFPLDAITSAPEVGLVMAVIIGFGFGFALERAGFGRATKLVAQFYATDMTVFKVMFSAIVTAGLGLVVADGVGLVDLAALSRTAASQTYLWPMLVGGLLLGAGFVVAGYCPGTSLVSAASGNLDGLATFGGVIAGTLVYAEAVPLLGDFPHSGNLGHLFLYELLGIPAAVFAALIAAVAVLLFVGAERLESIFVRRAARTNRVPPSIGTARLRAPAFALVGGAAGLAVLVTIAVPRESRAVEPRQAVAIDSLTLAQRVFDEPWSVRVIDLRDRDACAEARVPGSECVPRAELGELGLEFSPGSRDLVLVGGGDLDALPAPAAAFPGRVLALEGGFPAWKAFVLDAPEPPAADATDEERALYVLRAGFNKALTGVAPPPPPPPAAGFKPPPKKPGGGCN